MNTAELPTRVRHEPVAPAPKSAQASGAPRKVPVVVLSTDEALAQAIRSAAGDDHDVTVAASLEKVTQLAARGQCGIVVTDQALSQAALARVSSKLHMHDPAAITIAVGSQGDDHALIGLLSSAVVERFMMKPVSPALARLVLRSAATEYRSQQSRHRSDTLLRRSATRSATEVQASANAEPSHKVEPASKVERSLKVEAVPKGEPAAEAAEREAIIAAVTRIRPALNPVPPVPEQAVVPAAPHETHPKITNVPPQTATRSRDRNPTLWMWVAVALAALASLGWWTLYAPEQRVDLSTIIDANLKSAQAALAAGNDTEPPESSAAHYFTTVLALDASNSDALSGMQRIAHRMAERVKDLIIEGRLAEAGIALERLRNVSHDARRLAILEGELRRVQTQQLAELDAAKPVPAEEQPRREVVPPVPRSAAAKPASQSSLHEPASETFSQATVQKTAVIHDESPESTRALVATEPTQPDPEPVAMSGGTAEVMRPTVEMNEPASTSMQTHAVQAQVSEIPAVEQEPRLLHVVQPEYPQEARMRGMEGWVDLTLTVNGKGDVADAHVNASSKRMFERPALMAVRRWQYEPLALPPGDSAHTMRVKVQFQMDGR